MGNCRNYKNKAVNMLIKCHVSSCLRNKKSSSDILLEHFLDWVLIPYFTTLTNVPISSKKIDLGKRTEGKGTGLTLPMTYFSLRSDLRCYFCNQNYFLFQRKEEEWQTWRGWGGCRGHKPPSQPLENTRLPGKRHSATFPSLCFSMK